MPVNADSPVKVNTWHGGRINYDSSTGAINLSRTKPGRYSWFCKTGYPGYLC